MSPDEYVAIDETPYPTVQVYHSRTFALFVAPVGHIYISRSHIVENLRERPKIEFVILNGIGPLRGRGKSCSLKITKYQK